MDKWRPPVLEGVFLMRTRLNRLGADEPNDGKAVMECEESLGLGTVNRSEIQVLTGVIRHHNHTLGFREGSADGDTKGYRSH
jgi:hypothetical protein